MPSNRPLRLALNLTFTFALACLPLRSLADSFTQINLVSDIPGVAANTDSKLKNPWGVAFSATSPFWVANQASGTATLYDGAGTPNSAIIVSIPAGTPPVTGPTGEVFNSGTGFLVNGTPSRFIFDTLNGTIAGWNAGTTAVQQASTPGAVYTGLALAGSSGSTYLYAANSASGHIDVFDSNWANVSGTTFAGKFVDPSVPAGFVPFNVQAIGSNLFVTYAKLTPQGTGLPGGYVDEFDANGNLIARIATGGALDAPWGITLAPSSGFGAYSGDLLVGNFGNGNILVYNPLTDAYLGTLNGANGQPLDDPFLWALETRTGGTNVNTSALYFTDGYNNQQDGLFGEIVYTPEPATLFETGTGLLALLLLRFRRRPERS